MARIRTVKPDFFTSDDICALTPFARLLYIGLWCEADREGRLAWAPKAFKRRYLPDDDCDIDKLCMELLKRDLVRLYGEDLAFIPTFLDHQHINPREAQSVLPAPDQDACATRAPRVSDAQVGRKEGKEGEGKEGNAQDASRRVGHASELPDEWQPSDEDRTWAAKARPDLTPALLDAETERFRNHAKANARTAHNWGPNWRNWIGKAPAAEPLKTPKGETPTIDANSDGQWRARLKKYRAGGLWSSGWGPRPETGQSWAPAAIIEEWREAQPQSEAA